MIVGIVLFAIVVCWRIIELGLHLASLVLAMLMAIALICWMQDPSAPSAPASAHVCQPASSYKCKVAATGTVAGSGAPGSSEQPVDNQFY